MGEVFLAQDTTLDRKVALKFLPEELQQDATAKKRFLREAKSAAALDHPYICHIHEVGEMEGKSFISMEYVQGETLKEKLDQGPLPLKDAFEKATEVAEALEEAHKLGIVHRDLKPSNLMLTPQGHVKVMDFGLAKQVTPVEGVEQEITTALTKQGSTLGTVPYMSPEQVRGQVVDTRSDIFSFGVVLYEMLTGVNPFKGDTSADTSYAILGETPPPLTRYTDNIPVLLQHTVRKMLAKEPDDRYQLIHDVRTDLSVLIHEIEEVLAKPTTVSPIGLTITGQPGRWKQTITLGLVALAGAGIGVAVWSLMQPSPPEQTLNKFVITPSPPAHLANNEHTDVAISPDGRHLVYIASREDGINQLYLRSLDDFVNRPIPGTEFAVGGMFFSPDGESVGFFALGLLKKVSLAGGSPTTLCTVFSNGQRGVWFEDTIFFTGRTGGSGHGLYRVPAAGGEPELLAVPNHDEGELLYRISQILPGGETLLFSIDLAREDKGGTTERIQIAALSLKTKERKLVLENARQAYYLPTGHLIYEQGRTGNLMAAPFDPVRVEVVGDSVSVVQGVRQMRGQVDYALSDEGKLVYVPSTSTGGLNRTLVWVDRKGQEERLAAEPHGYDSPRISPDGSRLAITINESGGSDVWIYDLEGEILTRFTFDPAVDHFPVWTPDGQRIVFDSSRAGAGHNLFWKAADGTGQVERLTTSPNYQMADSFSPDGKRLVFREVAEPRDLQVLSMEDERTSQPLIQSQFNDTRGRISPNGHWIAYESDESGRQEIHVRPFPNVEEGKWQISSDGGQTPVWGPNGQELFYRNGEAMMVVNIHTEPTFTAGSPVVLFTGRYTSALVVNYDISPDGQRFLMIKEEEGPGQINVVLNWFEELKRLVSTDN